LCLSENLEVKSENQTSGYDWRIWKLEDLRSWRKWGFGRRALNFYSCILPIGTAFVLGREKKIQQSRTIWTTIGLLLGDPVRPNRLNHGSIIADVAQLLLCSTFWQYPDGCFDWQQVNRRVGSGTANGCVRKGRRRLYVSRAKFCKSFSAILFYNHF
jgi:hypothetical protein